MAEPYAAAIHGNVWSSGLNTYLGTKQKTLSFELVTSAAAGSPPPPP